MSSSGDLAVNRDDSVGVVSWAVVCISRKDWQTNKLLISKHSLRLSSSRISSATLVLESRQSRKSSKLRADVAVGSSTDMRRCPRHVRFASDNGLITDVAACRFRATSRLMHCNKAWSYSITSSAVVTIENCREPNERARGAEPMAQASGSSVKRQNCPSSNERREARSLTTVTARRFIWTNRLREA